MPLEPATPARVSNKKRGNPFQELDDSPKGRSNVRGAHNDDDAVSYQAEEACVLRPVLRPRNFLGAEPSQHTKALVAKVQAGVVGPVLSLRTSFLNCRGVDLHAILSALRECESVHMLSIGRNDALVGSRQLGGLLVEVLRQGYVWACDWGELCFQSRVFEDILLGLEGDDPDVPATNLAFVFADVGCGLSAPHVERLKQVTRKRRCLDKELPSKQVDRTHAPWLQAASFGWVMRSENLTRCFWRPYQEAAFWRAAGFECPSVKKPLNAIRKWVNPALQPLCRTFHRGDMGADAVHKAFPPGAEGLKRSLDLLDQSLLRAQAAKEPPTPPPTPRTPRPRSAAAKPAFVAPDCAHQDQRVRSPVLTANNLQYLELQAKAGALSLALPATPPSKSQEAAVTSPGPARRVWKRLGGASDLPAGDVETPAKHVAGDVQEKIVPAKPGTVWQLPVGRPLFKRRRMSA